MGGFAYTAKASAATVTAPPGWPPYWPWPPADPDTDPYPPEWPYAWEDEEYELTLVVTIPATVGTNSSNSVEVQILDDGADTDLLDGYTIRLTATVDGAAADLRISTSHAWTSYVDVNVYNYSGGKYGWMTSGLFVNTQYADAGKTLVITANVLGVTPALTGNDSATLDLDATLVKVAEYPLAWDATNRVLCAGGYIYVSGKHTASPYGRVSAFTFDGNAFALKASTAEIDMTVGCYGLYHDGAYLFVGCGQTAGNLYIRSYSFDGTAFSVKDSGLSGEDSVTGVWGDGAYIYTCGSSNACLAGIAVADGVIGGKVNAGFPDPDFDYPDGTDINGDGTYVYLPTTAVTYGGGENCVIRALTFNGSAWTTVAAQAVGNVGEPRMAVNGGVLYLSRGDSGLSAYTFNGTTFTEVATKDDGGGYGYLVHDAGRILVACGTSKLRAYSYGGGTFTLLDTTTENTNIVDVAGDGTYVYCLDGTEHKLIAYKYQ